jgi:dihydroxy-acid dehydratase
MSGTSYGACILHVAPEAFVGGPIALLKYGDIVEIDVPARTINMLVTEEELQARRKAWTPPEPYYKRGYGHIFARHVSQANYGCDFDFLETCSGADIPEPDIF